MTTEETRIQELESREEVGALMRKDIVEIEGRKNPMMCYRNDGGDLDFIGRKNGSCISHIVIKEKNISLRRSSLVFNKPYENQPYFKKDTFYYNLLDRELSEADL
jgi:hypothetical protein|tara:strand:- start:226 stop:540 length:315 start_codon:yes stop_codon:yes gene_type:complete